MQKLCFNNIMNSLPQKRTYSAPWDDMYLRVEMKLFCNMQLKIMLQKELSVMIISIKSKKIET